MNVEQKSKWAEVRAQGRRRFLLKEGILKWGGFLAILETVGNYFFKYGLTSSMASEYLWSGETIFKFFFGWVITGLMLGLIFWYFNEHEYKKPEKSKT